MRVIHIMQDGTVRDSVAGLVIHNEEFYTVLRGILQDSKKEEAHE